MKVKTKAAEKANTGKAAKRGLNLCRRLPFSAAPSYFPLKGKKVYLDLKNFRPLKSLENDLLGLGATIEKFLSREINYLISSQDRVRSNKDGGNKDACKGSQGLSAPGSQGVSTHSPGISTPSPFNLGLDASPSLIDNKKKEQTSRGKAMFRMARVDLAKSVLDNAEKWGVKLIHIDSALKWIRREKDKALVIKGQAVPSHTPVKKNKPKKEKSLKCPVVKFESDTEAYKPLYLELKSWPHVNVDTPAGSCPFDGMNLRSGGKRAAVQAERLGAQEPVPDLLFSQPEDCERDVGKAEPSKAKEQSNKTDSLGFGQVLTAGQLHRLSEKQRKANKKRGYCECCKVKYEDLHKHIRCDNHRRYVREERDHYNDLDKLIVNGPKIAEFIKSALKGTTASHTQSSSQSTEEYIELVSPIRGKSGLWAQNLKSPRTIHRMHIRKSLIPDKRAHSPKSKDKEIQILSKVDREMCKSPKAKYSRQKSTESKLVGKADRRVRIKDNNVELHVETSKTPRCPSTKPIESHSTERTGVQKDNNFDVKSCSSPRRSKACGSVTQNETCKSPAQSSKRQKESNLMVKTCSTVDVALNEMDTGAESCKSPRRSCARQKNIESHLKDKTCGTVAQTEAHTSAETCSSPKRSGTRQKGLEPSTAEVTVPQKENKAENSLKHFQTKQKHRQSLDNGESKVSAVQVNETKKELLNNSKEEITVGLKGPECSQNNSKSPLKQTRMGCESPLKPTHKGRINCTDALEIEQPKGPTQNNNEVEKNCRKNRNKSIDQETVASETVANSKVRREIHIEPVKTAIDSTNMTKRTRSFQPKAVTTAVTQSRKSPSKVEQGDSYVLDNNCLLAQLKDCSVTCEILQISASEIVKTRSREIATAFGTREKSETIKIKNTNNVTCVLKQTENIPSVSVSDNDVKMKLSSREWKECTAGIQSDVSDKENLKLPSCGKTNDGLSSFETDCVKLKENHETKVIEHSERSARSTCSSSRPRKKARIVSSKYVRNCKKIASKAKPTWRTFRSVRHFRLPEKWRMLTDRSVCKMLESEDENSDFDGFTEADLSKKSEILSDLSYEHVSEIRLEEGSEIEWEIILKGGNSPRGNDSVVNSQLQTNTEISENEASAFQSSFSKTPKMTSKTKSDDDKIDLSMINIDQQETESLDFVKNLMMDRATSTPSKSISHKHLVPLCQSPQSPCVVKNNFVDKLREVDSDTSFIFSNPISSPLVSPLQTPSRHCKLKEHRHPDDKEIVFNFSSPQRLKDVFSPLKSTDCYQMDLDTSPFQNNETCISTRTPKHLKSRTVKRLDMDADSKRNLQSQTGQSTSTDVMGSTSSKVVDKIKSSKPDTILLKPDKPPVAALATAIISKGKDLLTPRKGNKTPIPGPPNRPLDYRIRHHSPFKDWSAQAAEQKIDPKTGSGNIPIPEKIKNASVSDEIRQSPRPKKSLSLSNEKKLHVSRKLNSKAAKPKSQPLEIRHVRRSSLENNETCGKDLGHQNKLLKTDIQNTRASSVYRFDYITTAKGSASKRPANEKYKKRSRSVSFSNVNKKRDLISLKRSVSPGGNVNSKRPKTSVSPGTSVSSKRPRTEGVENVLSQDSDLADFDQLSVNKWKKKLKTVVKKEEYQRRPKSEIFHYSKTFLKKQMCSAVNLESKTNSDTKLRTSPRKQTSHFDFESSNSVQG